MMGEGPTTSSSGGVAALMQMLGAQAQPPAQPVPHKRHKPVEAGELFPQVNSHSALLAGLQAVHHRHQEARMKSPAGMGGATGAY